MEFFGNEIKVQQGEDWNYDVLLSQSQIEYIPFIISNQRINPFFVITVASTKYEKNLRYVASWWNDILSNVPELPTFYQTVPYNYGTVPNIGSLPSIPGGTETKDTRLLYQYIILTEAVDPELGHRPYHYFYFNYNASGTVAGRVDEYECRVRFNFSSAETSKWGSQNYMYQVTLVSGQLMADTLNEIALAHGMPEGWPKTIEKQYAYVKTNWPGSLQPDIDVDSPLGRIEVPQVILAPTKLQVFNNLRQII